MNNTEGVYCTPFAGYVLSLFQCYTSLVHLVDVSKRYARLLRITYFMSNGGNVHVGDSSMYLGGRQGGRPGASWCITPPKYLTKIMTFTPQGIREEYADDVALDALPGN